jgi:hypothetical protein
VLTCLLLLLLLLCLAVASAAAADQQEEGNAARAKLQALLARKQEAANKLELLQQEIAMMANLNPAELAALEKEVGGLVAAMSAAEAKKAAMEMQVGNGWGCVCLLVCFGGFLEGDLCVTCRAGGLQVEGKRGCQQHVMCKGVLAIYKMADLAALDRKMMAW